MNSDDDDAEPASAPRSLRSSVAEDFRGALERYADPYVCLAKEELRRVAQLCVVDALIGALALADYERSAATLRDTFEVLSIKRF